MNTEELLANPAIQGAIIPFVVALIAALLLRNTRSAGLAIALGVLAAVTVTIGWSFESMGSTRKLSILLIAAAVVVAVVPALVTRHLPALELVLAAAAAGGVLWVASGVLRQMENNGPASGFVLTVYALALVLATSGAQRDDAVRATSGALMLGLAAGGVALLGNSVVNALWGIAAGAGAGALLLVQMLRGQAVAPSFTLTLPVGLVAAAITAMAILTGGVRWYVLLPLFAVPWAARFLPRRERPVWLEAVLASLCAFVPAALALALGWYAQSAPAS